MQAPLAHDYDGIQWRPLDAAVQQRITVAPGYTALVENDPGTDAATLRERIPELPDDVRSSDLVAILIAARPVEDQPFDTALTVTVTQEESSEAPVVSQLEELEVDGDWLVVRDFPDVFARDIIDVELGPAAGWEYGITVDRVPYGGFAASLQADDGSQEPLRGSLAYETIFEQLTDRSRLIEEDAGPAVLAAVTDPFLATLYTIVLTGFAVFMVARHRLMKSR